MFNSEIEKNNSWEKTNNSNIDKTILEITSEIFWIIDKNAWNIEVNWEFIKKDLNDIYNKIINKVPISKKEKEYFYFALKDEKAKKIAQIYLENNWINCKISNFINNLRKILKNYPFVVDFELKNILRVDENIYRYEIIKNQKLLQWLIIINENNEMILSENYEKISYLGNWLFFVTEEENDEKTEWNKKNEKKKNWKIILINWKWEFQEQYKEEDIILMEGITDEKTWEKYILTTDCSLQKWLLKLETEWWIIDFNKIINNENFKIILKNWVIFAVKNKKENEWNNVIWLLRAYFYNKDKKNVKKECLWHIFKDNDLIFHWKNEDILEVITAWDNIKSFFKFDKNEIWLIKWLWDIKLSFPKYSWDLLNDFIDWKPVYIKYNSKEKQKNWIILKNAWIIYFIDLKKYFSVNDQYKNIVFLRFNLDNSWIENIIYKKIINRFKFINWKAYLLKDKYKIIEWEKNTEDFNIMKKLFNKWVNINDPWEKIKKYYKEIEFEEIWSFGEKNWNN